MAKEFILPLISACGVLLMTGASYSPSKKITTTTPSAHTPPSIIVTKTGDFAGDYIPDLVTELPGSGSEGFTRPEDCEKGESARRNAFKALLTGLYEGTLTSPSYHAKSLGFVLSNFTDTVSGNTYYLLTESSSTGAGIFAINPSAQRPLVIEAPHPRYDLDSDAVAAEIFRDTKAVALIIGGTHRCANAEASPCDGTTESCGDTDAYRVSDPAHFSCSFFQAAHEAFADITVATSLRKIKSRLTTLQIHGFGQDDDDPDAILSDGVTHTATTTDAVLKLASALNAELLATGDTDGASACQADSPDDDGDGISKSTELCSTVNIQGRYSNGISSENCCEDAATTATQRFIHLELSSDLRHDNGADDMVGPAEIITAIKKIFPATKLSSSITKKIIR